MTWRQRWRRYGPDAKTFLAATIFVLVATLCWGFLQRVQQADSLIDTAEQSVAQVRDLRHQLDTQEQLLAEQQRAATERARRARAERDRLQEQLALVLDYLRQQGIEVPTTLTSAAPGTATSSRPSSRTATRTPRRTATLFGGTTSPSQITPGKAPKSKRPGLKPGQMKKHR